jgi:hypothetical protein
MILVKQFLLHLGVFQITREKRTLEWELYGIGNIQKTTTQC